MPDARAQRYVSRVTRNDPGGSSGTPQMLSDLATRLQAASHHANAMAHRQIDEHVMADTAKRTAELRIDLERLSVEHPNPTEFQTVAQARVQGILGNAHPETLQRLQPYADELIARYHGTLTEKLQAQQDETNRAHFDEAYASLREEIGWAARNGDYEAYQKAHQMLVDWADDATGRKAGADETLRAYYDETEIGKRMREVDDVTAEQRVWGEYEREPNKAQFAARLAAYDGGKKGEQFINLTPEVRDRVLKKIQTDIRHRNVEARRARAEGERAARKAQERKVFELRDRLYRSATDPNIAPPTLDEIEKEVLKGNLDPDSDAVNQLMRGVTVDRPEVDDPATVELLERMHYQGGNIMDDIDRFRTDGRITDSTASRLRALNHNETPDPIAARRRELADVYRATGKMGETLPGVAEQRALALQEFDRRTMGDEPEDPADVFEDLAGRFNRGVLGTIMAGFSPTSSLPRPRFAVDGADGRGVDVAQSKAALAAALKAGAITKDEARRQARLLRRWDDLQRQAATLEAQRKVRK